MHSNQLDSARFQFISPAHCSILGFRDLGPRSSKKEKKGVGTTVGMSALRPPPRSLSFQVCTSALREFTMRGAASSSKRIQRATCNSLLTPLHCLLLICGNFASEAADSAASPSPNEVHAAHLVYTSSPKDAKGAQGFRVHGRVSRNKTQDAMHPNVSA